MYSFDYNREKIKKVVKDIKCVYSMKKTMRSILFDDKVKLSKSIKESIDSKYFKLNNCDGNYINFSFNKKMRDNVNEYGEKVAIYYAIDYLREIIDLYYKRELTKKQIKMIFLFDCSKQNILITI